MAAVNLCDESISLSPDKKRTTIDVDYSFGSQDNQAMAEEEQKKREDFKTKVQELFRNKLAINSIQAIKKLVLYKE